ncbi:MAG: hypothetical protein AAGG81_04720 [Chlamydiota bacterium]
MCLEVGGFFAVAAGICKYFAVIDTRRIQTIQDAGSLRPSAFAREGECLYKVCSGKFHSENPIKLPLINNPALIGRVRVTESEEHTRTVWRYNPNLKMNIPHTETYYTHNTLVDRFYWVNGKVTVGSIQLDFSHAHKAAWENFQYKKRFFSPKEAKSPQLQAQVSFPVRSGAFNYKVSTEYLPNKVDAIAIGEFKEIGRGTGWIFQKPTHQLEFKLIAGTCDDYLRRLNTRCRVKNISAFVFGAVAVGCIGHEILQQWENSKNTT